MQRLSLTGLVTAVFLSGTALAQQIPLGNASTQQQIQQLLKSKNSQEAVGQAVAVGLLVNCTQKTAGKEATQAFYQQVQAVGEDVKAACKRQDSAAAQRIVLATLDAKKNDPVLKGAITCYDTNAGPIQGMAGAKVAGDISQYARWAKDPVAAHQEMKPTDICR